LSKVIKASQITGEYKLEESSYLKKREQLEEEYSREDETNSDKLTDDETELIDEIILEAKAQAAAIIEEAQNDAKSIKDEMDRETEEAYQKGFEKGYQEGLEKGAQEGEKKTLNELNILLESFDNIIRTTKNELDNSIEDLQADLINMAVQISRKIVGTQMELNPQLINEIVFDMLRVLTDIEELNIHIDGHLMQYINVEEFKSEFMKQTINFIGDNNLKPGDCIIETNFGGKDATIENKLNLLERELLKGAGFNEED